MHAVTALIPVKEYVPEYLRDAVGSLLAQSSPRWRALIIHARGARAELQAELGGATADPRIELVEEEGRKLAGALNTGMRMADTPFTAILFADDLWAPETVEILERSIQARPEVDFFHSARRVIDDRGRPISGVMAAEPDVRLETFVDHAPVKHLLCWRRELALGIGGIDESLNSVGPDDHDFPWSMAEAGARFGAIQECLYVYRDHRAGYRLTTHLPLRTHLRETRRILRKHGVPRAVRRRRLADARRSYLRQCLYSSPLDAWLKRVLGHDPAHGWRESYH
jgi:glycosyltransferase involved in cell wall biosynthesis